MDQLELNVLWMKKKEISNHFKTKLTITTLNLLLLF